MAPEASQPTWKTTLGFAERVAVINHIAASLKLADPYMEHSDAIKTAQSMETDCLLDALSQDDYSRRWQAKLQEIKAEASSRAAHCADTSRSDDSLSPASEAGCNDVPEATNRGITIGHHMSCRHHSSGLFSTIYKSVSKPMTLMSPAKLVALKVTVPSTMLPPHDSHREARILEEAAHKFVIPLLEAFNYTPSQFVLVFPFYKYTFDTILNSEPRLSLNQITTILQDVLCALEHIHQLGIIHRDVKPSNILLSDPDGPAVLADFGIAWSPNDPASEPFPNKITDVGTTCYRPPEILFGGKFYGTGLDMWAFGCLAAECFTRDHEPFFDAGDLGSELTLIGSIFKKLGTPTAESWPESARLPDFGKILFRDFPPRPWDELLPDAPEPARGLVKGLLKFESGDRLTAQKALAQKFFD